MTSGSRPACAGSSCRARPGPPISGSRSRATSRSCRGPVAVGLYRIAQECLTNALRHACARSIVVRVAADADDAVALSVEDDGGGDPASLAAGVGHGLLGIRERIAALGGSFAVGRAASGIRVAATIPFLLPRDVAESPTPA